MSTKIIEIFGNIGVVPSDCLSYKQAMNEKSPRVLLVRSCEGLRKYNLNGYGGADNSFFTGNEADAILAAQIRVQNALDA